MIIGSAISGGLGSVHCVETRAPLFSIKENRALAVEGMQEHKLQLRPRTARGNVHCT